MTPRTTAYSAMVWPDSSLLRRRVRIDTGSPIVGAARFGNGRVLDDSGVLHPDLSPERVEQPDLLPETLVEIHSGRDQGEVREGLREVAQELTRGSDLLGVEAQMVGVREHLLERQPGLV